MSKHSDMAKAAEGNIAILEILRDAPESLSPEDRKAAFDQSIQFSENVVLYSSNAKFSRNPKLSERAWDLYKGACANNHPTVPERCFQNAQAFNEYEEKFNASADPLPTGQRG